MKQKQKWLQKKESRRLREGLLIFAVAVSLFLLLSLATYHRADPGWSYFVTSPHIRNAGGRVGAWLADFFLYLCGYLAFLFPMMLSYTAWLFYRQRDDQNSPQNLAMWLTRLLGFVFTLAAGTGLLSLHLQVHIMPLPFQTGGILGDVVGYGLQTVFNPIGTTIVLTTLLLVGTTLFTGLSWLRLIESLGAGVIRLLKLIQLVTYSIWARIKWQRYFLNITKKIFFRKREKNKDKMLGINRVEPTIKVVDKAINIIKAEEDKKTITDSISREISKSISAKKSNITPELSLLDSPSLNQNSTLSAEELAERSRAVELRLADFGVEVKVVAVHPGPVVTRYELELAAGTKVSKITNLAKDLARSLSVISVRVVEVIPGKSVIGIELPNKNREMVTLQEIIISKQYQHSHASLALGLGKDISGHPVVVDLAKMPHLLVAGTTGSGKSVNLNAMLLSLLYKCTPQELRLILIDPKMLELAVYDGIPHLLTPVVTDMKDAAVALRWCVMEMERRYRLMASLGVRNISGYNLKIQEAKKRGAPLLDPLRISTELEEQELLQKLPKIVVLADEFADMMAVVGKKVETLIARLAQKARAAGIHLILATQRPSVDVITGLIKANIPTRIAFQVSSKVDSRTILDQQGAEQLLGHGDMLYLAPGTGVPVRVHGAYVADEEVHRVVDYLKKNWKPEYVEEILDEQASTDYSGYISATVDGDDAEQDPVYDEAVKFVTQTRRVSVSSIQRRFKIGYNRAARIVEAMEVAGVVSTMENNGGREVLAPAPVKNG